MRFIAALLLAVSVFASFGLPGTSHASSLTGDVNDDCAVNIIDLFLAAQHYGYEYGSLNYSPVFDVDGDRDIDIADLQMIAVRSGDTC